MVLRVNSQTEATLYDQPCVSSWREVLPLFSVTRTCVASQSNASAAAPTSASVDIGPNDECPKAAEMVLRVNTETHTIILPILLFYSNKYQGNTRGILPGELRELHVRFAQFLF